MLVLFKSTPRDDELSGTRATPGIVFKGHQRPSTVTGQAYVGQCNSKPQIEEGILINILFKIIHGENTSHLEK